MDKLAKLVGRQYHLFDYVGPEDAEKVIVIMGSGADTVHETIDYLVSKGEKVGVVKGSALQALQQEGLYRRSSKNRKENRSAGQNKRAGFSRRAVVSGCLHCHRGGDGEKEPSAFPKKVSADCRRTIRAGVKGIYAGDGKGRL